MCTVADRSDTVRSMGNNMAGEAEVAGGVMQQLLICNDRSRFILNQLYNY